MLEPHTEIHLLVVDDDFDVRSLMQLQLQSAGYQVSTAVDGADALEQIRQSAPALVISDILMPELDGFGLCRALRDDPKFNTIPFIFLTAHYLEPEDEELAQRLGAANYLIKGGEKERLLSAVQVALEHDATEKKSLALRFPELSELACELHLQRLYAQLSKKLQQLIKSEARLVRSEAHYRSILDSAPDSIVVSDQQGRIILINQRTEELFGYSREELLGKDVELLIAPHLAELHRNNRRQFLASDQIRLEKRRDLGLPARCKNGNTIPVEINLGSLNDAGEITVTAIIRDIRERLLAEEKIRYLNRIYRLLSECNQSLIKTQQETELLDQFCQHIVKTGGYAMTWVGYSTAPMYCDFKVVASAGAGEAYSFTLPALACNRDCPLCQVCAEGKVLTIDPQTLDAAQRHCLGIDTDMDICRSIVLPLAEKNRVLGVLVINATTQMAFDDIEELRLLNELAGDLSHGICSLRRDAAKRKSEVLLHLRERALEASRNGILLLDALAENYPVVYANPAFKRISGYGLEDLQAGCLELLVHQDTDQSGLLEMQAALRYQTATEAVLRCYRKDGGQFWNEIGLSPVPNERGEISHFVMVMTDISERMAYQQSLEHQSNHDSLTQLPNRNLLSDRLEQALHYSRRHQHLCAVLFVDLDRFKTINDSQGHAIGDQLICALAARLTQLIRAGDTVSRWGGDEFVLILADIENPEQVADICTAILTEIAKPVELGQHLLSLSCSVGCSLFPEDAENAETLLKYADVAMYRAKAQGGNRFRFFEPVFNDMVQARFSIETALRQALDSGQLELYYQPVIDLDTGRIRSAEALVRWNHPTQGLMFPGQFIPIAEESGLIVEIGNQVIDRVCEQFKVWQEQGLELDSIAINVSAKQFAVADMRAHLSERVAKAGLDPAAIEIELTETVLIGDQPAAHENLRQLKSAGFSLSLDDFGTGYSSLNYLRKFPVNRIKIDRSFIRDLATDEDCANLVLTILSMAKTFRCQVIAEGVETAAQLQFLKDQNCDYMQGFYFSQALPVDQFEQLLKEGRSVYGSR